MTYFAAAVAASGIFLVAGWRSKRAFDVASLSHRNGAPHDPLWAETDIDLTEPQSYADVGAAIRLALQRVAPVMASQVVQADLAAPSGLMVRMRGAPLADLLEELLAAAIQGAPASRILVTAAARGERVYVSVTDDMPNADPVVRAASVRGLTERVAMRGGALDLDVRPTEGTTMTLRLAAVTDQRADEKGRPPATKSATEAGSLIPTTTEH